MIPRNVRAVCFDAVGTLLFPEPSALELYSSVAARHGLAISPEEVQSRFLAAYRAEEAIDQFAGWITSEAREIIRWRRIVTESLAGVNDPEACFRELFHHFSHANAWRVYPRAASLFAVLLEPRNHPRPRFELRLAPLVGDRWHPRTRSSPRPCGRKRDGRLPQAGSGILSLPLSQAAECEPNEVLFVGDDFENDYEGARMADCMRSTSIRAVAMSAPNAASRDLSELLD